MHSLGSLQWEDLRLAVPLTVALSTPNSSCGNHLLPSLLRPKKGNICTVAILGLLHYSCGFLTLCLIFINTPFIKHFSNDPHLNVPSAGSLIHKYILLLKAMISPFPKMLSIFMKVFFFSFFFFPDISFDILPFQAETYLGFFPQIRSQHNTKGLLCGSPSHKTSELYLISMPVAFSCYKMPHHKIPHL